jgi:HEAT repeat protein
MTKQRIRHRAVRNRKPTEASLANLRTFDVDDRRQPEALLHRMMDKDLFVRQVAAVALARMSEQHPARLLRGLIRLREALKDDSAYVRWHVVYVLGRIMSFSLSRSSIFLWDLVSRLDDENRVVQAFALIALRQLAARNPAVIRELLRELRTERDLGSSNKPPAKGPQK